MMSTGKWDYNNFWFIETQSTTSTRDLFMLWNRYGDDNYVRWIHGTMPHSTVQHALNAAQSMGWETEVIYSGQRYHMQKSYADNMMAKRDKAEDMELEDVEIRV